jgi:putative transposase
MYVRGLSTRDIEDALFEATGDIFLSKASVSRITEELNQEYEKFQTRDLSIYDVEYLFLDAVYEGLRARYSIKEAILCAWGITRDGRKILLSLALGNKESYRAWLEFLRNMVKRGLRVPTTVTTDGAPGLIKAVEDVFPQSLRIRCWYHKMQNLSNKVPADEWQEVKQEIIAIRDAPNWEAGKELAKAFCERYASKYPSLVMCLKEDLEASLNHLKVPVRHRKSVRTTNLVERSFEEERRRSKVIPQFLTEKAALKLVFAVLVRASRRWQRVRFTAVSYTHLTLPTIA